MAKNDTGNRPNKTGPAGPAKAPEGFVSRNTLIAAVVVALLAGGFLGAQIAALLGGHDHPTTAQGPAGMPPSMPGEMPGGAPTAADMKRIQTLEADAARKPMDAQAWAQLGHAYFDVDQYQKAVNAYQKSLAIDPNQPDVWTDMGVMYRGLHQPTEAIKSFDKGIEQNPRHEIARFNKGIVYFFDLGEQDKAIQAWEELLKINPAAKTPTGTPVADLVRDARAGTLKK